MTIAALAQVDGVSVEPAGGTAYLFPRIADGSVADQHVAEALLKDAGVIVNPGYQFGAGGQGHFRLCFAQEETAWSAALDRMSSVLKSIIGGAR